MKRKELSKYKHTVAGVTTLVLEIEDKLTYEMCDEINKSIDERKRQLKHAAREVDDGKKI